MTEADVLRIVETTMIFLAGASLDCDVHDRPEGAPGRVVAMAKLVEQWRALKRGRRGNGSKEV